MAFTRAVSLIDLDLFQTGASLAAGAKAKTWTKRHDHASWLSGFSLRHKGAQVLLGSTFPATWACSGWASSEVQCLPGTRGRPGSAGQYFSSL